MKRATRAAPFAVATSIRTNEVSREGRTWPKRLALSIAGASFAIAKFFAFLFLVLFLIFLILGLTAARKIVT